MFTFYDQILENDKLSFILNQCVYYDTTKTIQ